MIHYPRFIAKLYANAMGYYWMPCPICHRDYGGHEMAHNSLLTEPFCGKCVCWRCDDKAKQMNKESGILEEMDRISHERLFGELGGGVELAPGVRLCIKNPDMP